MSLNRYKPVGWRGDSHRHYLAAKGIKTKYQASRDPLTLGKFGSLVQGQTEIALHSQDPTQERSKEYRRFVKEQRAGVEKVSDILAEQYKGRQKVETLPVAIAPLSEEEKVLRENIVRQAREGKTAAEIQKEERKKKIAEDLAMYRKKYELATEKHKREQAEHLRKARIFRVAAATEKNPAKKALNEEKAQEEFALANVPESQEMITLQHNVHRYEKAQLALPVKTAKIVPNYPEVS